jgi:hypothetical protein
VSAGKAAAVFNTFRNINLGPTGQTVKTSAGEVAGWAITNNAASPRFVKFYDTASVPDQTFTPLLTLQVPANAYNAFLGMGNALDFKNGIAVRGTTGAADNDTGAPAANDLIANIFYA